MSALFFSTFMYRAAEVGCSETGCQTVPGIETTRIQTLKLWLMTMHLFMFMFY